jgi:radical SAM protein with 4Fe4S-binding SPASM domain
MKNLSKIDIQDLPLWKNNDHNKRALYSFDIELTARCNLNCRHCYINLPAKDRSAKAKELSFKEIESIADQAMRLGALWVLLTGGEPLLRSDFPDIYLMLKRKGFLVSVFTNATILRKEHIDLFKKYSPRDIEVTIYGASQEVYDSITRVNGSYRAFVMGLTALKDAGIPIRLKAMALRSNLYQIEEIAKFGRQFTKDYYRFDPVLHLRYDRNEIRNQDIRAERLTPGEIAALEKADRVRFESLMNGHDKYFIDGFTGSDEDYLLKCGAGTNSFSVGYDGTFRLCASLWAPGATVNLREVKLKEAWEKFVPHVRNLRTENSNLLHTCGQCSIVNLCMNCPAHAYLETGNMEAVVPYFCQVAHTRAAALKESMAQQDRSQS